MARSRDRVRTSRPQDAKVIAAMVQVHPVAMSRKGDVAAMRIHAWRRQHIGAISGHALGLVDGRRIPVVAVGIVFQIKIVIP